VKLHKRQRGSKQPWTFEVTGKMDRVTPKAAE
jgi:hypothetical protein